MSLFFETIELLDYMCKEISIHEKRRKISMIQNDLKFFTNEPERDLYTRFVNILKSNIRI